MYVFQRLGAAASEMEFGEEEGNFDIIIVNDDLDTAYQKLREFVLKQVEGLGSVLLIKFYINR